MVLHKEELILSCKLAQFPVSIRDMFRPIYIRNICLIFAIEFLKKKKTERVRVTKYNFIQMEKSF